MVFSSLHVEDKCRHFVSSYLFDKMPPRKHKTQAQVEEEQRAKKAKQDVEQKKSKLIELVCQHEVLYNTAHPDYLNSSITDVLWEEVAHILEEDGMYFTFILFNNMQKEQQ